mmetsp:Transcript_106/g.253  ORF Transcript_106/g.253 Transcript_106/m.253 type:complete len:240 (+) Transcript_106:1022-1741(+)
MFCCLRQQILVEIPFQLRTFLITGFFRPLGDEILKGLVVHLLHDNHRVTRSFLLVFVDLAQQDNGISPDNVHAQWNVRVVGNCFLAVLFVVAVKPSLRGFVQNQITVLIEGSKIPHQMPSVSQDNHDSLIQFFHQTRGSRQIGRNVTKGNSRVGRDLLGRSSPSPSAVALVHVHNTPSTGGRASTSAASSPSAATSAGSRLRGWDLFLLGRGGRRRWHLLIGTRLHGDCGGFLVGMKKI